MGEEMNSTVLIGRSVELHCQSDAIPPPTLSWRKDGRPLYRKPGLSLSEDGSVLQVQNELLDLNETIPQSLQILVKVLISELHFRYNNQYDV